MIVVVIIAWIAIAAGVAGAAGQVIALYASRARRREVPDPAAVRDAWYWIGLSFFGIFSGISALGNAWNNGALALGAGLAAGAIACAYGTAWAVRHVRGGRGTGANPADSP